MDKVKAILMIVCIILLFIAGICYFLYREAIRQGAMSTLTALQMVVACEQVGNVTIDQIKEQYLRVFILNKTREVNISR